MCFLLLVTVMYVFMVAGIYENLRTSDGGIEKGTVFEPVLQSERGMLLYFRFITLEEREPLHIILA